MCAAWLSGADSKSARTLVDGLWEVCCEQSLMLLCTCSRRVKGRT